MFVFPAPNFLRAKSVSVLAVSKSLKDFRTRRPLW